MKKVLVIGGISYNMSIYLNRLPDPVPATLFSNGFHETVGATGTGKALPLAKLGFDVTLHGLIGDDHHGGLIREYFRRAGVHLLYDIDPKGTERHVNLMDSDGGRVSIYVSSSTFEPDIDLSRFDGLIASADYVFLNIINYTRRLIPVAKAHGKTLWCDIHNYDGQSTYHRDFVDAADVIFVSSDNLPDYRAFMQAMIDGGKRLVICTHGKRGSTALGADGTWVETPAIPYPLKDANGAGDNFSAGFLYAYDCGYPLEVCLRMGTIVGGLAVTASELVHPDLTPTMLDAEYRRVYGEL